MGLSCGSSSLSAMAFLSSLNLGDAKPRHVCPECKDSGYLERWGTEHGHRRWRCSRCGKTFSETLGTVQYRSRIGRLPVGIGSVLTAADMSVRALAATMGIDKKTALRYRHMMMAELSKRRLPDWLSGHAWVDGTFWPLPGSASVLRQEAHGLHRHREGLARPPRPGVCRERLPDRGGAEEGMVREAGVGDQADPRRPALLRGPVHLTRRPLQGPGPREVHRPRVAWGHGAAGAFLLGTQVVPQEAPGHIGEVAPGLSRPVPVAADGDVGQEA